VEILIDAQLPPALASLLIGAGHQAHHVAEVGLRDATDRALCDHAVLENAVIFTKDEDFALLRLRAQTGPTVVWLRVGNSSNLALQRWVIPLLSEIDRLRRGIDRGALKRQTDDSFLCRPGIRKLRGYSPSPPAFLRPSRRPKR
jgi:predicted nuclease of predicted toxin-antitoxin system